MEKRKRMVLVAENMPDEVYEILAKQAEGRNLTQYVSSIMLERDRYQEILSRLERIENIISNLDAHSIIEKRKPTALEEDSSFSEGKIIEIKEVKSSIEEDDKEDLDF